MKYIVAKLLAPLNAYIKFIIYILSYIGLACFLESSYAQPSLPACQSQLSSTMCEKIGQMLIIGFGGLKQDKNGKISWQDPDGTQFNKNSIIAKEIKNQHVGGVILFTRSFFNNKTGRFIQGRNVQNPVQLARLTRALQNYSSQVRKQEGLPDLPLLITIDQEGGVVDRLPSAMGFPQRTFVPQALGANEDIVLTNIKLKQTAIKQTRRYADKMADVLFTNHFNVNFAPMVDVNINPLNPIIGGIGRSFSANPEVIVDQAWQFIEAFHHKGIIATLKHFPGHGSSTGDTHVRLVNVTDTYQRDKELIPYQKLINRGYQDIIMTTHVINGQIDRSQCKFGSQEDQNTWCPGTMSYATLTKLLRQRLGFKGVIVSDDMAMGAIANEYPLDIALEKAINAGVDMFIVSNNTQDNTEQTINTIAKLVKEGRVSEAEINRAYQHITTLKNRLIRQSMKQKT